VSATLALFAAAIPSRSAPADDLRAIAVLDTAYQLAVKTNDAAMIERILAPDMVLVTGRGKVYQRGDFIEQARNQAARYEKQDEVAGTQQVRLLGEHTAVVTALLWIKGQFKGGNSFDYRVWFSDTYVRTPGGWRYAFGQSSLPLPKEALAMKELAMRL
jgi:uncharacterized protein (TIGR02246 family)